MSVLTPLTLHLAVALGVYALAGSLGLLLSPTERRERFFDELVNSPGLVYAYGALAFIVGSVWVSVHQDWMTGLGIVVTLTGWIVVIEGVLLLALPQVIVRIALAMRPALTLCCIIGIVIGALLILAGITGRADAMIEMAPVQA